MTRIELCREEYRIWCENIGISRISEINSILAGGKAASLINLSETRHEQKISEIAKTVQENSGIKKIIFVSGPSSSGKTSFTERLRLHLKVLGVNSVSVSLDDYYKRAEQMPLNDEGKPDYEALESIDYRRFNDDVSRLLAEGRTVVPKYDFLSGKVSEKELNLKKGEVIITEGIHGLNEKLAESVPDKNKYRIYCSPLSALQRDDGERIKSRMIRFMRRMVRDYYFRNADYKLSFELWPNAEKGAEKNIFPYTDSADIIFNSALLYEIAAYRPHLAEILKDVPEDFEQKDTVREMLELSGGIAPIDEGIIPPSSIIKEFIGGSSLF